MLSVAVSVVIYVLILLAGLLVWFQWSHRDLLRAASKVPSVLPTLPLMGHAYLTLMGMEKTTEYCLRFSREAVNKGISVACFWCGPLPVFIVHGLEDIQIILKASHALHKPTELTCLERFFGFGLLTAPVEVWKVARRYINPLFHPRNLDQLMPTFNRNSRELVAELSRHVGDKQVDVMGDVMTVALKTVCHLIFGPDVDFDTRSESFRGLMKVVERLPHYFTIRALRPWLRLDPIFYFFYRSELAEVNRMYKNFTESPIKITKARNEMKNKESVKIKMKLEEQQEIEEENNQLEGPVNLVEVYSSMQKEFPQFTDKHLQSEMLVMFGTGTDTTGTALASSLLILAQYQDIQDRLHKEITSVLGPEDEVTLKHLPELPYLDQVYKETLRWSTILHYVFRKTTEDIKLSTCIIPAGNTIIICLGGLLMDPKIFPNPEKFIPERFSSKNALGKERCAFLPFSKGPRNCIGQMYAHLLIKVILIHVVRKFKLSTDMDIQKMKRTLAVTLFSSEGYNIKFENRC